MSYTCSFCGQEVYNDKCLMDLNNNKYCSDCAKERLLKGFEVSLCHHCGCMTYTLNSRCGKCQEMK